MGGIRRAGVKALTTCELQALSRRNLNILLAEYPEVGDELKRVARDRASVAKKGKPARDTNTNREVETPTNIISKEDKLNAAGTNNSDAKYLTLVEKEIDRIVNSISIKLRNDVAQFSVSNGKELGTSTTPRENDDDSLASSTHSSPEKITVA